MNALLNMHVSSKNSLHYFVIIFERALASQREKIEDHHTLEKKFKIEDYMGNGEANGSTLHKVHILHFSSGA